jgi:hypothetical protein
MRRWQLAQSGSNLGMWIPREATLSIEEGPGQDQGRVAAAVNLRGLVRPMGLMIERMMKGDSKTRVVVHGDHEVVVSPGGSALSFAEGTVLFGSSAQEVTTVLDRWARGSAAAPRLPASIEDLSGRFDVYGSLHRAEEARSFLALVVVATGQEKLDDSAISRLASARFGIDARTADEAEVLVELAYETPEAAQDAERTLAGLFSGMQARARAKGAAIHAWAVELMRREK